MRIGLDVVETARVRRIVDLRPTFVKRTFTIVELAQAAGFEEARRYEFLAGRFAAKEATLKALGLGIGDGIALSEIEITSQESGAPALTLTGEARRAADAAGCVRYHTSISHDAGIAAAVVLLT